MTLGDIIRMEEMVKKKIAEREQVKAEGAAHERAKIVAWLRSASNGSETVKYGNLFADEIEAKEHLK